MCALPNGISQRIHTPHTHTRLSTWLAAFGDADKSRPPSHVSFSPAYTLPLSLLSPITNTHTLRRARERSKTMVIYYIRM